RKARGNAAQDPKDLARADPLRADLGLFLAERDRAARRGSLADEDRSLSVGGAAGRCEAETAITVRIIDTKATASRAGAGRMRAGIASPPVAAVRRELPAHSASSCGDAWRSSPRKLPQ